MLIDCGLSFNNQIRFLPSHKRSQTSRFYVRTWIRKLIHAFTSSRLDYFSGPFKDLPQQTIKPFQLVQNPAAEILTNIKRSEHITPICKASRWLPGSHRIDFKAPLLVYKSVNWAGPKYRWDVSRVHMCWASQVTGEKSVNNTHCQNKNMVK